MNTRNRIFLPIIALALLSGCVAEQTQQQRDALVAEGKPPQYADGYKDGCASGQSAAGNPYAKFAKDVARFNADKLYSQGWNDGFGVCKGRYESISRSVNSL